MTAKEITDQLESIASEEHFAACSGELTDAWESSGIGVESVEPILRFMEEHPSIDYGVPGSLVHFVETFYGMGYDERLLESIKRKPTSHTVWMLNRLINGAKTPNTKRLLVAAMEEAAENPLADEYTLDQVNDFLERL